MKLKPCPSCGYSDFEEIGKYTECTYCNCRMPTHQWNTRHYPQDTTKEKLTVAISALEKIAKKATFTEIRRMATEALEKIK